MRSILLYLALILAPPVFAQSVSPDGVTYAPAYPVDHFSWMAGVDVVDTEEVTVLRDGNAQWTVETPVDCAIACEVFRACVAFTYTEPRLFGEAPVCRMVSSFEGTSVNDHSHLYIKDAPGFGFTAAN